MSLKLELTPEVEESLKRSIEEVYRKTIEQAHRDYGVITEYLSIEQVCSMMKISRNTLSDWLEAGLPKYVLNRKHYIKKTELNKFIDSHQI